MKPISPVEVAHRFAGSVVRKGDNCVDATVGNGRDTAFLAKQVATTGKVLGFDVQSEAITNAQARLESEQLLGQVILKNYGHEELRPTLQSLGWQSLRLVMFNLGYLPGSDKSIITRTDTTLTALNTCLEYLASEGAVSIVAYRGHSGASDEYNAVQKWVTQLPAEDFFTLRFERWTISKGVSPVFFWVRRRR
ncbi:MAG: 16S rRNA (cytosine(1402)-N(4))-methyltransferase [Verrucomicrobia bacterium]|nr:16S rRNA (cytosine(1402)-N(4))-methyltransferase [Verrucomicrobiota bacterium]